MSLCVNVALRDSAIDEQVGFVDGVKMSFHQSYFSSCSGTISCRKVYTVTLDHSAPDLTIAK